MPSLTCPVATYVEHRADADRHQQQPDCQNPGTVVLGDLLGSSRLDQLHLLAVFQVAETEDEQDSKADDECDTVGQEYVNRRWPSGANIEDRQGFLEPWFAKILSDSMNTSAIRPPESRIWSNVCIWTINSDVVAEPGNRWPPRGRTVSSRPYRTPRSASKSSNSSSYISGTSVSAASSRFVVPGSSPTTR